MSARNAVLVHQGLVATTEKDGHKRFAQPEYPYSFDLADRVTFALTVLDVVGTADSWYLKAKFQVGNPNASGFQFAGPAWADLQREQVKALITEGVGWYAGDGWAGSFQNLAPRPSEDFTDWAAQAGTGGTVALTTPATGGYSGSNFARATWSVAATASGGGIQTGGTADIPVIEGRTYSAGVSLRHTAAGGTQRFQVGIDWLNGSNVVVGSAFPSSFVVNSGAAWTRATSVNRVAPAGAVKARIVVKAVGGTSSALWQVGDTLDVDAAMMVEGATVPPIYFDGSSTDAVWDGTPNASSSTWTNPGIVARNGDALPVTVVRTLHDFGSLARVVVQPYAVNPSADFAVRYSLTAAYRLT